MRILPDGTVEIRNKTTGETKVVLPQELPNYGIPYTKYVTEAKAFEQIKSVGLPQKTVEEKKAEASKQNVLKSINLLEENLGQAELRGPIAGRLGFLSPLTGGVIAPEVSDFEALRKGLIGPLARLISQEKGVLTDKDITRAEGLLPTLGDTQIVVDNKLRNLRSLLGKDVPVDSKRPLGSRDNSVLGKILSTLQSPIGATISPGLPFLTQGKAKGLLDFLGLSALNTIPGAAVEGGRALEGSITGRVPSTPNPFLTKEELERASIPSNAVARAIGDVAGLATFGIPFGKGANVLSKVLAPGAAVGATTELSRLSQGKKITLQSFVTSVLTASAGAWGLDKAGRIISAIGGKLGELPDKFISQLFKPSTREVEKLKANFGLDFAEEVVKRDLKGIQGKSGPEIVSYFDNKVAGLDDAADKFLKAQNKTLNKDKVLDIIDKKLAELQGIGRDVPTDTIGQLKQTRQAIETSGVLFDEIPLELWNQTKRDWQNKATFSGKGTPVSNAYRSLQAQLNALLEKEAPGLKAINSDISYNRLAKNSIETAVNNAQKAGSGLGLFAGGGLLSGLINMTLGRPEIAAVSAVPALLNALAKSPKFKTQAAELTAKGVNTLVPPELQKALLIGGTRMTRGF